MPKIICHKRTFPFVKKEFIDKVEKENKRYRILTMQSQKTIREHMLAYWEYGHIQSRVESWNTLAIRKHLEYTYPLLDRKIIEFMFSIPSKYFIHNGVGRYLFRLASKGLLPEKILWADTKEEPNRVKRLSSLMDNSFKLLVLNKQLEDKLSSYIQVDKLMYEIENLNLNILNKNTILMIMNIEISILVVLFIDVEKN